MPERTASVRIMEWFEMAYRLSPENWYAIHNFTVQRVSENAKAARMRELTRAGKLECRFREGSRYKEWRLKELNDVRVGG